MQQDSKLIFYMLLALAMVLPLLAIPIAAAFLPDYYSLLPLSTDYVKAMNFRILSLGLLFNGLLFFTLIKLHKDGYAQAVLAGSVLFVLLVIIYRYVL
jgi:prepilin signal peptidase PulO-like enzyme (type II secretory pathway)